MARIFPIYFLTLGIVAIFQSGAEVGWAATFTFNFRFLASSRDYFQTLADGISIPPVAHFWSLCVEEHFYWIWPALIMLLPFRASRLLPLLIVLGTPWWTYLAIRELSTAGFSHTEVDGLISRMTPLQLVAIGIGALAAFYEPWLRNLELRNIEQRNSAEMSRRRPMMAGLALMICGGLLFGFMKFVSQDVLKSLETTALHITCGGVFLAALSWDRLGKVRSLVGMGTLSYGAYLFHLPIYSAWGLLNGGSSVSPWRGLAACGLTLTCAALSYRLIEAPILSFAKSLEQPSPSWARRPRYLVGGGAALTLLTAVLFAAGLANPYSAVVSAVSKFDVTRGRGGAVPSSHSTSWPTVEPERIQTLILGSSHAANGLATPEFPEFAYNLAFGAQDLWYDCQILQSVLEKLPNLKRVVFGISVFSFRHMICDNDGQRWRQALYFHTWQIPARTDEMHRQRYSLLTLLNACESVDRANRKAHFADEPLRGWEPRVRRGGQPGDGWEITVQRHCSGGCERVEENGEQLLNAIRRCHARGVECVLVSTPKHCNYQNHLPTWYLNETLTQVRGIVEKTGVQFVDYASNRSFTDDDFYDPDHLNQPGAVKFTRMLLQDLHDQRSSGPNRDRVYRRPIDQATRPIRGEQLR